MRCQRIKIEPLTYEGAAALCRRFVPAGERIFEYVRRLSIREFKVFMPYWTFVQSFAETEAQLNIHHQCIVEAAKVVLGRPWPMRLPAVASKSEYQSELLNQLRAERDRINGVPENALASRFPGREGPWRREIDPVRRNMSKYAVADPDQYNRRLAKVLNEQKQRMGFEITIHCSSSGNMLLPTNRSEWFAFYSSVTSRHIAELGFEFDRLRSRDGYPVFCKHIASRWDVCWAIEDTKQFLGNSECGFFEPCLQLRQCGDRRRVDNARVGEFLFIQYQNMIPQFRNSYWKFFSLDQLELFIQAHLFLYSCIAPVIEQAVNAELS